MPTRPYKTWIEISTATLRNNVGSLKSLSKGAAFMMVVKANAYGHGLSRVVTAFDGAHTMQSPDWWGVDSLQEALAVRATGSKKPILILGYVPLSDLPAAVRGGFSITVYDAEHIKQAAYFGAPCKPAKLHLKVETGTSRQGVMHDDLTEIATAIKGYIRTKQVHFEGLSTHFANIEDTADSSYALLQLQRFREARRVLAQQELIPELAHVSASAGMLLFAETHFDMVRVGIASYGLWPSKESHAALKITGRDVALSPALTWKSIVAQVKRISSGTPVSYGLTETVTRDSVVAVVPVGYWDGFDRGLSSVGRVLIRGRKAKVLGRVCMNMIVVDVTDIPGATMEDEVVLIGWQERERISAEEMAAAAGTINYETVTRINPLLPRILVS